MECDAGLTQTLVEGLVFVSNVFQLRFEQVKPLVLGADPPVKTVLSLSVRNLQHWVFGKTDRALAAVALDEISGQYVRLLGLRVGSGILGELLLELTALNKIKKRVEVGQNIVKKLSYFILCLEVEQDAAFCVLFFNV